MSNEVAVYCGIRFAKAERFRPPEPIPLHEMPPRGGSFGSPAPQNPDRLDYMWGEVLAPGDEDCLSLNIWTPAADSVRRPVMVWIHGGAFIIGSGRWGWYEGTPLVQREQVVLVTINYRLGAFGFLDLSRFGSTFAESTNCGLLDQIAALRWVKQNIERFGGDPDCVTVFGESAGGISVSCLLACPQARGLFRRAICMSGPPSMVRSREFAGRVTERLMRFAGVETAEQLAALPTASLLAAQKRTIRGADFLGELQYAPTVDGTVLPRQWPLHFIRAPGVRCRGIAAPDGHHARTGARLWSLHNPEFSVCAAGALGRWLRSLGLDAETVRATYRETRPELGLGPLVMAIIGDSLFWLPQIRLAEAQAAHRQGYPNVLDRLGRPQSTRRPVGCPSRRRDTDDFRQPPRQGREVHDR